MRYIFDNNLPVSLSKAIHVLCGDKDITVSHLRERFPATISDAEFITRLSQEGDWVIITQDLYREIHIKEALRASNLVAFFLAQGWGNIEFWHKAYLLVRWWPIIMDQTQRIKGGAVFKVPLKFSGSGKLEQYKL